MSVKNKVLGGPSKDSFYKENVTPINFSESSFWDLGATLANIEKNIRDGKLKDILIIQRMDNGDGALRLVWRGTQPMTTALGMLAWAENQLLNEVDE